MARRVARLTLDTLPHLVGECSSCLFWQLDPVERGRACGHESDELSAWVSQVLREWGSCGRIVYVDDVAAGHVVYAPAAHVPGAAQLATAPVSGDAVLLAQVRVSPAYAGQGLGRVLVQAMAKDLIKRGGIRAVEAFGATEVGHPCVVPADFLLGVGFRTQRSHPRTPRMRMELRSLLSWRSDLEGALDRLLAPVRHQVPVQQPRQPITREADGPLP
ncbi:GNAT family N-acetyltransferase [Nocardioides mangrovicus]|uniref:GNAT family N-acetyltransferase n=1 Tax=Nocardioides mangrovicus TaxID=2478913 RepID=A0A3L8NY60_9ACTN|nr:GNAT family N-acetyltransferase [Nocardioides mangrovicus]RLV48095.1 GNAT family N-acetyltransferase [Nocardioides mangrovicus]